MTFLKSLLEIRNDLNEDLFNIKTMLKSSPNWICDCPHSKAEKHLRVLITPKELSLLGQSEFVTFLILTAIDQKLFQHLKLASKVFKRVFKGLPIPIKDIGFGCVTVMNPGDLLLAWGLRNDPKKERESIKS